MHDLLHGAAENVARAENALRGIAGVEHSIIKHLNVVSIQVTQPRVTEPWLQVNADVRLCNL